MIVIKLGRKQRSNSYDVLFESPGPAMLLALFLTDDVGSRAQSYIDDFQDDQDHGAAMNATQYTKEDGLVIITPEWVIDEEESIARGNFFSIKATVLTELLRKWQVVYAKQPSYIIITIEGDTVSVMEAEQL